MDSVTGILESIIAELQAARGDAEKADGGNRSAATRVRKAAQNAKAGLQDLRQLALDKTAKDD